MTNKVQSVLMDVCRTGQGLNVTVRFTIIEKQANQIYMLTFVTHNSHRLKKVWIHFVI